MKPSRIRQSVWSGEPIQHNQAKENRMVTHWEAGSRVRRWYVSLLGLLLWLPCAMAFAIVPPLPGDLPPDPGVAGDVTIEGIDVNGNGVRDDLEVAIFAEYGNNPSVREILYHAAPTYQYLLTKRASPQNVLKGFAYLAALTPCLTAATGSPTTTDAVLRPHVLNTYDRSIAYVTVMESISSYSSLPEQTVNCGALTPDPIVPPPMPASVTVSALNTSYLMRGVSWSAVPGATHYVVLSYHLDTGNSVAFTLTETGFPRNAGYIGSPYLNAGYGTYTFEVAACDSGGCSNYRPGSNTQVVRIRPPAPSNLNTLTLHGTDLDMVYWTTADMSDYPPMLGVQQVWYDLMETNFPVACTACPDDTPCLPSHCRPVYSGPQAFYIFNRKTSGIYYYHARTCFTNTRFVPKGACSDFRSGQNPLVVP